MTDDNEGRVDLSGLEADFSARAQRITARVMSRITDQRSVAGQLARYAIPALLAAAASIALLLATGRQARAPAAVDRLLLAGRPVAILELMVAMEDTR